MLFITLAKWRKKPTKEITAQGPKLVEQMVKEGAKILGWYWTLCSYDVVMITEGKDEKSAMKWALRLSESLSTETLIAVSREEAIKLLE